MLEKTLHHILKAFYQLSYFKFPFFFFENAKFNGMIQVYSETLLSDKYTFYSLYIKGHYTVCYCVKKMNQLFPFFFLILESLPM